MFKGLLGKKMATENVYVGHWTSPTLEDCLWVRKRSSNLEDPLVSKRSNKVGQKIAHKSYGTDFLLVQ